jgi:hypothetical protein
MAESAWPTRPLDETAARLRVGIEEFRQRLQTASRALATTIKEI